MNDAARPDAWVAFFDLLGTKDSASLSDDDLLISQARFHDFIREYSVDLSEEDRVYPFGDCCYIEFSDLELFALFVQRLRYKLFGLGYFFKCALAPGVLGYQAKSSPKKGAKIVGGSFGPGVIPVYRAHESFKGVGCIVVPPTELNNHKNWLTIRSKLLVHSCYAEVPRGRSTSPRFVDYLDVKYSISEVGAADTDGETADEADQFTKLLLTRVLSAKMKNINHGRYYISAIVAMVGSSDFSRLEYVERRWVNGPPIFTQLFENRRLARSLAELPGIEVAFFLCVQRAWEYLGGSRDSMVFELASRPWLMKKVGAIPRTFLSHKLRDEIVSKLSEIQVGKKSEATG